MSWSPPQCPSCSNPSTRFESTTPHSPPEAFGLYWECDRCNTRVLELCPMGVDDPKPGGCLNCGAQVDADGCCPACGVVRAHVLERVHAHCGSPPRLEAVRDLIDEGLFRVAFNAVDLRLEQQPNDAPTLIAKGKLLIEVCRAERAVPLLRRAIELGGRVSGVEIDLGRALAGSGRYEEAIASYEGALTHETDPTRRAVALSNIGGCLSSLGHARQAEEYHRRAVETDPEHLGPRWNLFANLFRNERYEAALEVVEQTMALPFLEQDEVENMQAYRAEILIALQRYREALIAIDLSLASDPNELNRLIARARILMHLNARDRARGCIAKILALDPENPAAKHLLSKLDRRAAPAAKN